MPVRCFRLFPVATSLLAVACIRAPVQTVQLSEVMGEQITDLQQSHIQFVQLYYGQLRQEVETFLQERWIPTFLAKAVANQRYRDDLDVAYSLSRLPPDAVQVTVAGDARLQAAVREKVSQAVNEALARNPAALAQVQLNFAEAALTQIQRQRATMIGPINEQEQLVIAELNASYTDLQRAQTTIQAYLASAVHVQAEQDVVLQKLGVLETQQAVLSLAARTSDGAATALATAQDAQGGIDAFLARLKAGQDSLLALRQKLLPAR